MDVNGRWRQACLAQPPAEGFDHVWSDVLQISDLSHALEFIQRPTVDAHGFGALVRLGLLKGAFEDFDLQGDSLLRFHPAGLPVDKRLEFLDAIEDSL